MLTVKLFVMVEYLKFVITGFTYFNHKPDINSVRAKHLCLTDTDDVSKCHVYSYFNGANGGSNKTCREVKQDQQVFLFSIRLQRAQRRGDRGNYRATNITPLF